MLFMQKERNMSEYIDFITYQDDAIIQRPLRYYRRRGQPHPQPKGDLHQGNRHRGTYHDDHSYGLAPGGCKTLTLHMVVFIREPTLALFDNTFVTHMDDFSILQIHNTLINSHLQKEHIKEK